MPPISQKLVDDFLRDWNVGLTGTQRWIELTGAHVLLEMKFLAEDKVKFDLDNGYPLKAFRNIGTGEVKIFDARRFIPK